MVWDPEDPPPAKDNSRPWSILTGGIIAMGICAFVLSVGAFIAEAFWGG